MIAFSNYNQYFIERNACLIGLSIDSNASHLAWMYDIYLKTGVKIPFPIIADRSGEIARKYGMIASDISNTATVRNVYLINPEGIIRLILVYPMDVGRCIPEILRSLEALQTAEECKGATPANWTLGGPIINPISNTYSGLEKKIENLKNNKNGISWYLTFKNQNECKQNRIEETNLKELKDKN